MYLNKNNNTKINRPQEVTVGGVTYPKQIFDNEVKLNELNIYKATVEPMGDTTLFTHEEVIDWNTNTISYTQTPRTAEEIRELTVPKSISMRQCRLKLSQMGTLGAVQTNIETVGGDALIEWEYAGSIDMDNPLVVQLGQMLGMTQTEIDTMFKDASVL